VAQIDRQTCFPAYSRLLGAHFFFGKEKELEIRGYGGVLNLKVEELLSANYHGLKPFKRPNIINPRLKPGVNQGAWNTFNRRMLAFRLASNPCRTITLTVDEVPVSGSWVRH